MFCRCVGSRFRGRPRYPPAPTRSQPPAPGSGPRRRTTLTTSSTNAEPMLTTATLAPHADSLGILEEALARAEETNSLAARYLDPSLVAMLHVIGFARRFFHARGSYLYDSEGRQYLDFHTGEGFSSLGHSHPDVRGALRAGLP